MESLYAVLESMALRQFEAQQIEIEQQKVADPVQESESTERGSIEKEICKAIEIDVLGTADTDETLIFSLRNRRLWRVRDVKRMGYPDLLRYCGEPAKEKIVANKVDDVPGMFSISQVLNAIGMLSGIKSIGSGWGCGPGIWRSAEPDGSPSPSVVLVNSVDAAVYSFEDGSLTRIDHPQYKSLLLDFSSGAKPWFDFAELQGLIAQAANIEFRQQAASDSIFLWDRWHWDKQTESPVLMTGLILATWIQSLWTWRPQVVILGKSKAGKSFLKEALAGIFRNLIFSSSDTTAAGLQQHVGHALPLVFLDEFDSKNKMQAKQRQEILEAFRASSRGDGLHRGTSQGKGRSVILRHLPWLAGIHTPHTSEADKNRIISMELLRPTAENSGKLSLPPMPQLQNLGQRLLACAIYCASKSIQLADSLRVQSIRGIDSRIVESYAIPAAIMSVMFGYDENPEDVKSALAEMLAERLSAAEETDIESDEAALMQDILTADIRMGSVSHSVAQLLDIVYWKKTDQNRAEEALASCGIKIDWTTMDGKGQRAVVFQYRPVGAKLLKNTRWEGTGLHQIMVRIEKSERVNRRVGGTKGRGVMVLWSIMEEQFFGKENPENEKGDF